MRLKPAVAPAVATAIYVGGTAEVNEKAMARRSGNKILAGLQKQELSFNACPPPSSA
jgi:hypothetical protein